MHFNDSAATARTGSLDKSLRSSHLLIRARKKSSNDVPIGKSSRSFSLAALWSKIVIGGRFLAAENELSLHADRFLEVAPGGGELLLDSAVVDRFLEVATGGQNDNDARKLLAGPANWSEMASTRQARLEAETNVVWLTVAVAATDAVVTLFRFEIAADGAVAVAAAVAAALVLILATISTSGL